MGFEPIECMAFTFETGAWNKLLLGTLPRSKDKDIGGSSYGINFVCSPKYSSFTFWAHNSPVLKVNCVLDAIMLVP